MTSPVRNASPVSLTPVTSCITGVVDTELILYRTFYTELFYTKLFYTELFYTELILYQTGKGRGDWGGALKWLVVIMSWKGERGLGWPAEGDGGYYELERGEGSRVAC